MNVYNVNNSIVCCRTLKKKWYKRMKIDTKDTKKESFIEKKKK